VLSVLYADDSIHAGKDLGETDKSTTKLGYQVAIPYWNTELWRWGLADIWHEVSMMSPTRFYQGRDITSSGYKIKMIGFPVNGTCYINGDSNGKHDRARCHYEEEAQSLAYHFVREGVARDE
jgi:hypothetical protein